MTDTMRAVVTTGHGDIEIQDVPVPHAKANEVIIEPVGTGICGTDLHLVRGDYVIGNYPLILGHEMAGYITEVGAEVTNFSVGDYVGANPNVTCGECTWCKQNATNLCEHISPAGIMQDGSCAEFIAMPAKFVYNLCTEIPHHVAPLTEPLSCVLHALDLAPDWKDQDMVIFGAGSIGLVALVVALDEGAASVSVVEPNPARRAQAVKLGAVQAADSAADLDRDSYDLTLDASGNAGAIADAIRILGKRGRLIQMGVPSPDATIDFRPLDLFEKEISLIGAQSLANMYPAAAERMAHLYDKLDGLVTGTFPVDRYEEALEAMKSPEHIKIFITDK
ncbi:alcohol dehydrogenase catalytic domain-containing protein [Corynebacterium sp. KPL2830]|uniref:alcohol dehydrogenase catalytic domain-containing protein n=1 Tax=Corynebacterium sp. KPL2830 TaxID=3158315 RepID=UPI0032EEB7FB